jgi:hypothetical protein
MHLRTIDRDGWLCTVYEQSGTGPGGVPIATGELYDVESDPYQFENLWDDPARRAQRHELVADLYASLPSERRALKVMAPA